MPSARRRRPVLAAWGCAALVVTFSANLFSQEPGHVTSLGPNPLENALHADAIAIEKAIKFSMRGDELAIASELTATENPEHVRLIGLAGNTRIQVSRRSRGQMRLVQTFELKHTGPANAAGEGTADTLITAEGDGVRITRTIRIGDVTSVVSLSQNRTSTRNPPEAVSAERVTLRVRSSVPTTPDQVWQKLPADLRVAAPSFAELLRDHPGPASRYLAPIFRDFQQEISVFRIDPRLAWQLFPDAVETDEATASKVLELVDRLDGDDFRDRELATAEIEVIGGPALRVLSDIDREELGPEQNARIDAILARYATLDEAEVAALRENSEFLLRCFAFSEVAPVRAAAVRALGEKLKMTVNLNPNDKPAARVRAADAFRSRLPEEQQP